MNVAITPSAFSLPGAFSFEGDPADKRRQKKINDIVTMCLVIIAFVATMWLLQELSGFLVPLVFAVFLAFLMEPVLRCIVLAPQRCCRRARRARRHDDQCRLGFLETRGPMWLQSAWDFIGVALCFALIVLILGIPIVGSYQAISTFDWKDYADVDKVDQMQKALNAIGINNKTWDFGKLVADHESQVMDVASATIGVGSDIVLTLLLFIFSLAATLPGIHQGRPTPPVRDLMRRYLVWKSVATLIITLAVVLTLCAMKVPLVPVCAMLTFILNFIPNVGSFFAILAPLPLVYFKKHSTTADLVLAGLVPFCIHNVLGCLLEPQLMAQGLELNSLVVVMALTFWGCVWGIPGAVLSVPITCAIKLTLRDAENQNYLVKELRSRLEDPLGPGAESFVAAAPLAGMPQSPLPRVESELSTPLRGDSGAP
ncbi:unnamed protein product [Prorocentrum cordatum]|uniref:AI-2E family transporter n=1 Tax=Prorocentrum cordatum TaxID=2364126 RepID=A0ABN9WUC9_9DINO|nr:unnamed protein product [Polarella glacialis]